MFICLGKLLPQVLRYEIWRTDVFSHCLIRATITNSPHTNDLFRFEILSHKYFKKAYKNIKFGIPYIYNELHIGIGETIKRQTISIDLFRCAVFGHIADIQQIC